MRTKKLEELTKDELLTQIAEMEKKLSKIKLDLSKARSKATNYKEKFLKTKSIVSYQRARIVQLYGQTRPI